MTGDRRLLCAGGLLSFSSPAASCGIAPVQRPFAVLLSGLRYWRAGRAPLSQVGGAAGLDPHRLARHLWDARPGNAILSCFDVGRR